MLLLALVGIGVLICSACWLPMKAVRTRLGELLTADATTLAPAADENKVILFTNNVNPNEDLAIGDLDETTFTGYAAIAGVVGAQEAGLDPVTGEQFITIKAPAGGWRFESTGATAPAQTIYGAALVDDGETKILAIHVFATPVTISIDDQVIDLGSIEIRFVLQPMA